MQCNNNAKQNNWGQIPINPTPRRHSFNRGQISSSQVIVSRSNPLEAELIRLDQWGATGPGFANPPLRALLQVCDVVGLAQSPSAQR